MKTNALLTGLAVSVLAVTLTACDKKAASDAPAVPTTNAAAASTVDTAKDLAGKAVDTAKDATATATTAVKDTAAKATDAVKDAVTPPPAATDTATTQFTTVVASTKQMLTDKNYQGALDELKKLADVKLTDDQQKIVDGLKAEAQKMITSAGTGAVNSLLGK